MPVNVLDVKETAAFDSTVAIHVTTKLVQSSLGFAVEQRELTPPSVIETVQGSSGPGLGKLSTP